MDRARGIGGCPPFGRKRVQVAFQVAGRRLCQVLGFTSRSPQSLASWVHPFRRVKAKDSGGGIQLGPVNLGGE